MAACASCGAENPAGKKFCSECGSALAIACPSCGAALTGTAKFCGECGSPLAAGQSSPVAAPAVVVDAPVAERRFVTVLFADLVGFTAASESRDAEDTRELLSSYFETCRRLIGLYGGSVEKFIGDAVMAVWGAPVATEDDAERAVRAALELVAAVQALGEEVGVPELGARRCADGRGGGHDRSGGRRNGGRGPGEYGVARAGVGAAGLRPRGRGHAA